MKALTKITSVAAVSAMVLLGVGCDRKDANTTGTGENVDNAVTNTQHETREAGNAVENTAENAGQAVENSAENAGQSITDATITTAVKGKYMLDDELKAHDINVDTVGGVVTLTGAAPSEAAIARATEVARTVDGVRDVTNQLTVKPVN